MNMSSIANRIIASDIDSSFLSVEMLDLLNRQIANEMYASYLYLAMSGWCQNLGYVGISKWFSKQSSEELKHASKVYEYIVDSGHSLKLYPIDAPPSEWSSILEVAEKTLAHEKKVTNDWKNIGRFAKNEDNAATFALVEWFMAEQMEEEDQATIFVQRARMAMDGAGLLILDQEMGQRE